MGLLQTKINGVELDVYYSIEDTPERVYVEIIAIEPISSSVDISGLMDDEIVGDIIREIKGNDCA